MNTYYGKTSGKVSLKSGTTTMKALHRGPGWAKRRAAFKKKVEREGWQPDTSSPYSGFKSPPPRSIWPR